MDAYFLKDHFNGLLVLNQKTRERLLFLLGNIGGGGVGGVRTIGSKHHKRC